MTEEQHGTPELPKGLQPIIPRDPDAPLPGELPRGAEIPDDLDPFADGILMQQQLDWLNDDSDLKICAKGRRTGMTFAEALDDTLIAASARDAGGDNIFYIGDTKDKGREFIGYVAHFARTVSKQMVTVEEFVFKDQRADGTTRDIAAFRANFASGFRVEALSSRPENIRGLQGIVVIDEAAFHKDVREVIDAVNALLIWGGKIRIISTHNGVLNPFNELIAETKAGKTGYSLHFYPFQTAIDNGLYKRVCLVKDKEWSQEAEEEWEKLVRSSYGSRTSAMRQELDGIPSDAEGAALTRVQIEACMQQDIPIVRWQKDDDFKNAPEHIRKAEAADFCREHLEPILSQLDPKRPHYLGEDFARTGDVTAILIVEQTPLLIRKSKLLVELRNMPFDQQREILFYIIDRLPRFSGGALDARGNGAYLAEVARQKYGETIFEVQATRLWYGVNSVAYIEAISDKTIILPAHEDVIKDHQSLAFIDGIIKVPENLRFKGTDGNDRHGDTAIAGIMVWFASMQGVIEYDYRSAGNNTEQNNSRGDGFMRPNHDDDLRSPGDRMRSPLGARMRGSV